MLRYLAIATAIVVGTAMAIAGWVHRDLIRIKIASVYAPVRAKTGTSSRIGNTAGPALGGDAAWALSALPECLMQTSETTGPRGYVVAHLPAGAIAVAAPATLKYGDCTIFVSADEAFVKRGADRFRIPPRVRFYRTRGTLALLRGGSSGGNELRVYQPATP